MMSNRTAESFEQQGAAIIQRALSDYQKRAFEAKSRSMANGHGGGSTRTVVAYDVEAAAVFEGAAKESFTALQEANSAEASKDGEARSTQLKALLDNQLSALALRITAARDEHVGPVANALGNKEMLATALEQLPAVVARTRAELGAKVWIIASKAATHAAATPIGDPGDPWYKRPIGIIGLAVAGGLVLAAALWAVRHYFP